MTSCEASLNHKNIYKNDEQLFSMYNYHKCQNQLFSAGLERHKTCGPRAPGIGLKYAGYQPRRRRREVKTTVDQ